MTKATAAGTPDFSIKTEARGNQLHITLRGTCDMVAAQELHEFLENLHGKTLKLGVSEVVVSIRDLYFLNSSGLKEIVTWITKIDDLPQGVGYFIRFLTNPNFHWQERSMAAIKLLAPHFVRIG